MLPVQVSSSLYNCYVTEMCFPLPNWITQNVTCCKNDVIYSSDNRRSCCLSATQSQNIRQSLPLSVAGPVCPVRERLMQLYNSGFTTGERFLMCKVFIFHAETLVHIFSSKIIRLSLPFAVNIPESWVHTFRAIPSDWSGSSYMNIRRTPSPPN